MSLLVAPRMTGSPVINLGNVRPLGGIRKGVSEEISGDDVELLLGFAMYVTGFSIAAHPTRSGTALRRRILFISGCRYEDLLVIEGTAPHREQHTCRFCILRFLTDCDNCCGRLKGPQRTIIGQKKTSLENRYRRTQGDRRLSADWAARC